MIKEISTSHQSCLRQKLSWVSGGFLLSSRVRDVSAIIIHSFGYMCVFRVMKPVCQASDGYGAMINTLNFKYFGIFNFLAAATQFGVKAGKCLNSFYFLFVAVVVVVAN